MENTKPIVIPTLSRTKISHLLSYPIGAESISRALCSASQFPLLKLHFFHWSDNGLRRAEYEFLRVEYLNNATPAFEYPIWELYGRPPQWRWEIVVQPVPRQVRHRIKQYIIESALPMIARWLEERTHLERRGSDMLTFFYDEKLENFIPRKLSRLEPLIG